MSTQAGRGRSARVPTRPAAEAAGAPQSAYVQPWDDEVVPDLEVDGALLRGRDLSAIAAPGLRIVESLLDAVDLTGAELDSLTVGDSWAGDCRWVGTRCADARFQDTAVVRGLFSGTGLMDARLRRVVFVDCKLDAVNLRGAELREVTFVDCVLTDVDFGGATLHDVSAPGSVLDGLRLDRSRATGPVDLREAARIGVHSGHESLRGVTISPPQLFDLAPSLASAMGLDVRD